MQTFYLHSVKSLVTGTYHDGGSRDQLYPLCKFLFINVLKRNDWETYEEDNDDGVSRIRVAENALLFLYPELKEWHRNGRSISYPELGRIIFNTSFNSTYFSHILFPDSYFHEALLRKTKVSWDGLFVKAWSE